MPVSETVIDAAIENVLTEGVQSYTVDGETTTATDPSKVIEAVRFNATRTATSGGSAWGGVKMARGNSPGMGS